MQDLSVLDIINTLRPRPKKTTYNSRGKFLMKCPLCEYDSRAGVNHYFSVSEDEKFFFCFVCGAKGNAHQLNQMLTEGHDYQPPADLPPPEFKEPPNLQGATISELCAEKSLDEDYCVNTLKWRDTFWHQTPAIAMPYYDENGRDAIVRYRVGINSGDRFRWARFKGGQTLRMYGLWNLAKIREAGYVILVEGETDFATVDCFAKEPVLGVPGALSWKSGWADYLKGIDVYFMHEPDRASVQFLTRLARDIDLKHLKVIKIPYKDVNEMWRSEGF